MPSLLSLFSLLLAVLASVSVLSTTALYFYPLVLNCSYPNPSAPFRLLTLADPQLEGNTAIYSKRYASSPRWISQLRSFRKSLDLWGNDLYLAHIYRTLHTTIPNLTSRFSFLPQGLVHPTHVVVLGDLIGSQWINDEEFASRGTRFWNTVFPSAQRLPERALSERNRIPGVVVDKIPWPNTLINVVGNHDIGYSGDIRPDLIKRFEDTYGPVNYAFSIPFPSFEQETAPDDGDDGAKKKNKKNVTITPSLRMINLNSLNIDSPARDYDIQMQTYDFMNSLFGESGVWDGTVGTVLLTHVPLHKPEGVCVDPPMEKYYEEKYGSLLKEQNHISQGASEMLLGELFGVRRVGEEKVPRGKEMGIILTGHDHEGCDVVHWHADVEKTGEDGVKKVEKGWKSGKWGRKGEEGMVGKDDIWIREVTVRSMMGDFGGNAGLTTAEFDRETMSWKFQYSTCPVGTQHIWWTVHIVDFITLVFGVSYGLIVLIANRMDSAGEKSKANGAAKTKKEQ
ncbi:hypothetical protein H072_11579 [Dactylellina haptotyla CBS 200.50]|uniref:Calcineurin-like phosphoesterase domain-containing protein n=1 Tax=Dactylellina haptotyla (strain CBS 200.50) TaxID=1284197 RepID=S7ZWY4_DACHA|nr:hypothetical protein H072_11579 [Dactylellina haptotyla CBS 200.50]